MSPSSSLPPSVSPFPLDALNALVCPHCGGSFVSTGRALRCSVGHSFDLARQGYAALNTGAASRTPGDDAEMVRARERFLDTGHFRPLDDALARLCARWHPGGPVLDAGTGTGHHLAAVLDAVGGESPGIGLDTSAHALRRAARAHPRAAAVRWDVRRPLPVAAGAAGLVLNVFAPRNGPEFARVLSPEGCLVIAVPTVRHFAELREAVGLLSVDRDKDARLRKTLSDYFREVREEVVEYQFLATGEDIRAIVSMGPTARHVNSAELARRTARTCTPLSVTISVRLLVQRPR